MGQTNYFYGFLIYVKERLIKSFSMFDASFYKNFRQHC